MLNDTWEVTAASVSVGPSRDRFSYIYMVDYDHLKFLIVNVNNPHMDRLICAMHHFNARFYCATAFTLWYCTTIDYVI